METSFLSWNDIQICRLYDKNGKFVGGFAATITFRFVKAQKKSFYIKAAKRTCLTPPNPHTIVISPVYRLLIMLLRRGLLKHYKTPDELFSREHHNITIQKEALALPVFLSEEPDENGSCTKPMNAENLSNWLKQQALDRGYPADSTMYS